MSSEKLKVVPMSCVQHIAMRVSESFLNRITNESRCKRKYVQMSTTSVMRCRFQHLKDIDLMAFSYMCLRALACADMTNFTGFHHNS